MTDRYNHLTVALEQNTRSDDAEALIAAIKQMRGVLDVEPNVATPDSWVSDTRARQDLAEKLWRVLYPKDQAP